MGEFLVIDLATGRGAGLRFLEHILGGLLSTLRMVFGGGTGYGDDWLYWGLLMKDRSGLESIDDWATPKWLYDELDAEFHFNFDPCPLHADFDGLAIGWGVSNFVNPPYNRIDKPKFIKKAYEQWRLGRGSVLLIPAATGTKEFHDLILPHAEIRFLRGRVAFEGLNSKGELTTTKKGMHDSMLAIFHAGGWEWVTVGKFRPMTAA